MTRLLVVSPPVDLQRENGLSLPLYELLRSRRAGLTVEHLEIRPARPVERLWGLLKNRPWAVSGALPRAEELRYAKHIESQRYDGIVLYLGVLAPLASYGSVRPVCVVQDALGRIARSQVRGTTAVAGRFLRRLNAKSIERFERTAYGSCAAVTVVSAVERNHLERHSMVSDLPSVHVVPNGVTVASRYGGDWANRPLRYCVLGDFRSARNRKIAHRAISSLTVARRVGVRGQLWIMGWEAETLIKADATDSTASGVIIRSNDPDPPKVLKTCRLILAVDPESTGIKNSVLLAMAHGVVPVILKGTDVGVPLHLVEQVADNEELTSLLRRLELDHSPTVRSLARKASACAEWVAIERSWSAYSDSIIELALRPRPSSSSDADDEDLGL